MPAPTSPADPRLRDTLWQDVRRVSADIRHGGIRRPVRRTLGDLQEFYLSSSRRQRLAGMRRGRRALYLTLWLIKALFLRLTPTRRVLLILGFVFLTMNFQFTIEGTRVRVFNLPFVGTGLVLLVLALELKDKLLARDELEAGRAIQQALMPASAPDLPGWDVWLLSRPANDVGGDLVDALRVDEDRMFVALGDVAGKGLPAALLMAKLQATLRALAPESASLPALAAAVNRILCRDGVPSRFATLVYVDIRRDGGLVRLFNAGHMPPLVLGPHGVSEGTRGGPALGLMARSAYEEQRVDLAPGDALVVYSDGITEAMNAAAEFFGDERLRAAVARSTGAGARELAERIVADVVAFAGDAPAHDDISVIVLRRT
jgi:hypothetical protein